MSDTIWWTCWSCAAGNARDAHSRIGADVCVSCGASRDAARLAHVTPETRLPEPVQGEGCPDHPGPLQHWTERAESCWACDIRWVYYDSPAHRAQMGDPYYVALLRPRPTPEPMQLALALEAA